MAFPHVVDPGDVERRALRSTTWCALRSSVSPASTSAALTVGAWVQ
ncbi:MAG: hypothetical protein M5R40_14000 [Anaerolineae bacterium]|nr:hypothetical protein [Anaerolineae bacterium]